jgi:hypothetical protein
VSTSLQNSIEDLRDAWSYSEDMGMLPVDLDAKAEKALNELTADGRSATEAVREALVIAQRLHRMEPARVAAGSWLTIPPTGPKQKRS